MNKLLEKVAVTTAAKNISLALLFFRVALSLELMIVHGLKKIGIGVADAEQIPNPLQLPAAFNDSFAIAANLFFPIFILAGFLTRWATIPILAVTLTGFFVVHGNDSLLEKDVPYLYSIGYLFLLIAGAGQFSADHIIHQKSKRARIL